uniref:CYRIA/CYRIB Rac1 binding domain-containing protein n=1 Tax=Globodera rostochiensis TaxID=31243 RepID=A0A914HBU0_GLORO
MLAELLNPAFKRYVKRAFGGFRLPAANARVPPRRARGPSSAAAGAAAASIATAKRRVALQLLRRCLQSVPLLPRLPPFQCPKCSLLSRRPGVMLNHICAKKLVEFKNVTQIVELGFRSRVRDALAALERIPNPQAMQFTKFCRPFTEAADHVTVHQPSKLSDIVLKFVQRWNTVQIVQTTQPVPPSHQLPCHSMTSPTTEPTTSGMVNNNSSSSCSASSTGFFCAVCGRLFGRYADWDAHLLDEEEEEGVPGDAGGGTDGICPYNGQQPTPIECPPNELFPRNGLPIVSRSATAEFNDESANQNHSQRQQQWHCSTCALQHFATRAEFHAHLLKDGDGHRPDGTRHIHNIYTFVTQLADSSHCPTPKNEQNKRKVWEKGLQILTPTGNNDSDSKRNAQQQSYNQHIYDDIDVFLDFEHCRPSDQERALFLELESVLQLALRAADCLATYGGGASMEVRAALQNCEDAAVQSASFAVVRQFVRRIRKYFETAQRIEKVVPELLWELCSGPLPPAEQLGSAQALCKQLARLIDFVFRFDAMKMNTPALQNDFSFFRRVISRSETAAREAEGDCSLELANTISLFLASPTPMLNALTNSTTGFVRDHPDLPVSNTTETLTAIVYICRHMLERKEFYDRLSVDERNFFLRVMVSALILFDHIDSAGAFCRHSPVDVRGVVEVVKQKGTEQQANQLMDVLRYTSKHLNDLETPKSVRALFNERMERNS